MKDSSGEDQPKTGQQASLRPASGSPPRRRVRIEIVGYGDTYEDALDAADQLFTQVTNEGVDDAIIGGDGWVKLDEKPEMPAGEDYLRSVREYRQQRRENGKNRHRPID